MRQTVYTTSYEKKCCSGYKKDGINCVRGEAIIIKQILKKHHTVTKNSESFNFSANLFPDFLRNLATAICLFIAIFLA